MICVLISLERFNDVAEQMKLQISTISLMILTSLPLKMKVQLPEQLMHI